MMTATPTNVAANLYNRGVPVVLMNVNVWGTLGMLGLEQKGPLAMMEDLAGRHVGVPCAAICRIWCSATCSVRRAWKWGVTSR